MNPPAKAIAVQEAREALEVFLEKTLSPGSLSDHPVWQAARYSLLAGGKRIRPLLLFRTCLLFEDRLAPAALPLAASLEMIHSYSLIHDDLPAMDDDDFRRGRPSCHKAFGEAVAILAGDLLLNTAYEVMLTAYEDHPDQGTFQAMKTLARAAGGQGMILGQDLDLALEKQVFDQVSLEEVQEMAKLKTSRLIQAALLMGGQLAAVPAPALDQLALIGESSGLAFQIRDDILDCMASRDKLGKTPKKDAAAGKKTFVTLAGLEGAREALRRESLRMQTAYEALEAMGYDTKLLAHYTNHLIERKS